MAWYESVGRYGDPAMVRSDGAKIDPTTTAGGNVQWTARLSSGRTAMTDRGYTMKFRTMAAARKWIEKQEPSPDKTK